MGKDGRLRYGARLPDSGAVRIAAASLTALGTAALGRPSFACSVPQYAGLVLVCAVSGLAGAVVSARKARRGCFGPVTDFEGRGVWRYWRRKCFWGIRFVAGGICTGSAPALRIARICVCFDDAVSERRTPQVREIYWMFGCGLSVIIALACATFGTIFDIQLVAAAKLYCEGDLSAGEKFAGNFWSLSRFVIFPVVSVLSALVAQSFQLLNRLPWLAGRLWSGTVLLALTVVGSIAGPVAMTLYDLAAEGTPAGCVLPWWPSWLPS
ncbi:hypothetical protein HII36_24620 [Nonomuraea sp. NN258]|uniref:hypothetical protein n=1 Tax=Nonomuraea antri TaxID=2730852 RepID=UPI00156A2D6A|nr:hypothetical protein [Nonomuraea antri]NRQ34988.1 hypothetical protein [Nonomuraea antri]